MDAAYFVKLKMNGIVIIVLHLNVIVIENAEMGLLSPMRNVMIEIQNQRMVAVQVALKNQIGCAPVCIIDLLQSVNK